MPDPVCWWKLAGNLNDSSGNSHTLSAESGSLTYSTGPNGVANTCGVFDGSCRLWLSPHADTNLSTTAFTFLWWEKSAATGSPGYIMSRYSNDSIGYYVIRDSADANFTFRDPSSHNHYIFSSGDSSATVWHMFAYTSSRTKGDGKAWYDNGTDVSGYVSDSPDGGNLNALTDSTGSYYLSGRYADGNAAFTGSLANVRIYKAALTQSEIQAVYSADTTVPFVPKPSKKCIVLF